MLRGEKLEVEVFDSQHIQQVLAEAEQNFRSYFDVYAKQPLDVIFRDGIAAYTKEQQAYEEYLDLEVLEEYSYDPNAFKSETRKRCPIIRRCLMSQDEVMKDYKIAFGSVSGRELLDAVQRIATFGQHYSQEFDDKEHEAAETPGNLGLDTLNSEGYGLRGVIGYGVQSSLLYGLYPREFAHRSQNAVWSLYFLSGRKDFGLQDGSEFLVVNIDENTCEQNFTYPAELFGFYSLRIYLLLKTACQNLGVNLLDQYRYIYLSTFTDFVAGQHRDDIKVYRRSSQYVESQPWF